MKDFHLAITKENENGGKCAYTQSFNESNNLLSIMERIPKEAIFVHLCSTKKQAFTIADAWNEDFKRHGVLEWF